MGGTTHPEGGASSIERDWALGDLVVEARRRAEEIIRRAEGSGGALEAFSGPGGSISKLLAQVIAQLDQPTEPMTFELPVAEPPDLADAKEDEQTDSEEEPVAVLIAEPQLEDAGLEDPPPGRRFVEVELAPVSSPANVADLEKQIVGLEGVTGVRIRRREGDRVTFLVGTDDADLDLSPLLDRGARLEAASSGRIVLRLDLP